MRQFAPAALRGPIFRGGIAHGYLILSSAAGLFVDRAEAWCSPITDWEGRASSSRSSRDVIKAALTVKTKTRRSPDQREVRWAVEATNQDYESS